MLDFTSRNNSLKVENNSKYKLVFSIHQHPQLGVVTNPYIIAYTLQNTLSLTYQKVFSGNASYYDKLSDKDLQLIKLLDPLMIENIIRKFSPKQKIRPKEYFQKYFDKSFFKEEIRPYIDEIISIFFKNTNHSNNQIYLADEINPAAHPIEVKADFTKVLFHFRKNENGTSYFVTLKHDDERILFMKQNGLLLSSKPARILVHNTIYKFYDFVDGNKIGIFLHKKYIHIKPENQKSYYQKFVRHLLETSPVLAQGFSIETKKESATPQISIAQKNGIFGFNLAICYGQDKFDYHPNKFFHVKINWEDNEPVFTKYKRSVIWESNKSNLLIEKGLTHQEGSFFNGNFDTLQQCVGWIQKQFDFLTQNHFEITSDLDFSLNITKPILEYAIQDQIDWFDLKMIVTIGEYKIPFSKIVSVMKKGQTQMILPNGELFLFPEEWFALGESLFHSKQQNNQYAIQKYELNILNHIQSQEIKKHLNKLVNIQDESTHSLFKGSLRPYQKDGLSWLMFLINNRFGGILADDMGLGKTIQALAFIQKVYHTLPQQKSTPPFLIVAPTSLLFNWVNECSKFTPELKVCIHSGNKRHKELNKFRNIDLIITSYGLIRNDAELFEQAQFEIILLDESQNIKNYSAKTTQYINKLKANCRIALTGTPIENTIKDLWSQMNFLNKGLLGSLNQFNEKYAKPIEKEDDINKIEELKRIIKPFLLRRTKEEVAKDLPDIQEKIIYCGMSDEQEKYYEKVKSEYRNNLLNIEDHQKFKASKLSVLQGLSKLRQISNHPILMDSTYAHDSGKHELLLEKIQTGIADGHKILVFSQFVTYLELLEKALNKSPISYYKLTGATNKIKRHQYVHEFQTQNAPCVFLISLKAGGVGLNLTAADYVFIADPWWNPAAEAQARDRSHRIGQTKPVFSYKFISKGTIEEKITRLQNQKKKMSSDLIHADGSILSNLNVEDLKLLLD